MTPILLLVALLAQNTERGKKEFNARCAGCHFIPDASLRTDRVWLGLVKTTA